MTDTRSIDVSCLDDESIKCISQLVDILKGKTSK